MPYIFKKMKKIVTISLFAIYLLLQIGITTHVHMCHETITDIELFNNSNITCTIHTNSHCCSTENNHNSCREPQISCATSHSGDDINCCENTTVLLQYLNNTQHVTHSPNIQLYPTFITKQSPLNIDWVEHDSQITSYIEYGDPPPEDLVSLNCSFIFYG